MMQTGQLIVDRLGLDESEAVELVLLDYGRGDLGEFCRGILQRVQEVRQMSGDLDVALGRGGLDVDSDVGEELGDVVG